MEMELQKQKIGEEWCATEGLRFGITWLEYQAWTEWMAVEQRAPRMLYENPACWQHRAFMGKWMVSHGRVPEGIKLLYSTIGEYDLAGGSGSYMDGGEERAWCLKDLSLALWLSGQDLEAALEYMEQALFEVEAVSGELFHISRGEVWGHFLMLLEVSGRGGAAAEAAEAVLRDAGKPTAGTSCSYVFFACRIKAFQALKRRDAAKAAAYMRRGLAVYAEPELTGRAMVCLDAGLLEAAWDEFEQLSQKTMAWDDDCRPRSLWRAMCRKASGLAIGKAKERSVEKHRAGKI